jgi:hypothetical protein
MATQSIVKVASFNILASGLASNEFICEGGDIESTCWEKRGPKIAAIIGNMLATCDVVVTQENDQFRWLYDQLKSEPSTASLVGGVLGNNKKSTSSIGVYYNRERVCLHAVSVPGGSRQEVSAGETEVPQVEISESIRCEFLTLGETVGTSFSVYGAHLKSGEAYSSEIKRCAQLEALLRHMQGDDGASGAGGSAQAPVLNPILAMDSNNSAFYELEYTCDAEHSQEASSPPLTVSRLLKQYGFRDALEHESGFECFKMRHNQGGQPSKFFNMMFDRIDKIVVRQEAESKGCTDNYGFARHDADLPRGCLGAAINCEFVKEIRLSAEKRSELKDFCTDKVQELLEKQKKQIAEGAKPVVCSHDLFRGSKFDSFVRLYPNKHAPSDHPPVSASVVLRK